MMTTMTDDEEEGGDTEVNDDDEVDFPNQGSSPTPSRQTVQTGKQPRKPIAAKELKPYSCHQKEVKSGFAPK